MLNNYQAISTLLSLYAEKIDLGDLEGIAELFKDAEIKAEGNDSTAKGYDQVLKMYQQSTRLYPDNGTPHTKHVTTNFIIDIDNDTAAARSYFTVYQSLPDFPLQAIIAGRYHDKFKRQENHWYFTERVMIPELFGDLSRHLLFDSSDIQTQ